MQYVVYALYSTHEWPEVKVPKRTWARAVKWIKTTQHYNGGWNYNLSVSPFAEGPYGSMTATGVMALKASGVSITSENMQKGLKWLENHYTITSNPGSFSWHHYYLLSLMRALEIPPSQEFLGEHDWYDQISRFLVHSQKDDGRWVDVPITDQSVPSSGQEEYFPTTCFAVLFLTQYLPKIDKPDFAISSEGIEIEPEIAQEGKPVNIKITISNSGKAFEGSVPVSVYDGDPSVGGKLIEKIELTFPKSHAVVSTNLIWKAQKSGYHRIFVRIDAKATLDELTRRNNLEYQEMEVKGKGVSVEDSSHSPVRIADGVYRIGSLTLDINRRRIEIPGSVNQISSEIEFLACGRLGKLHESVIVLDTEPVHLYIALLRLGLKPGFGVRMRGDPRRPKGDPLIITVEWDQNGDRQVVRAEELIFDISTGEAMEETEWIFSGSRTVDGVFRAQETKSFVATYRDPDALINNPLPGGADDTIYRVNFATIPPKGTQVNMLITPVGKS
jgi:hypothetical protein